MLMLLLMVRLILLLLVLLFVRLTVLLVRVLQLLLVPPSPSVLTRVAPPLTSRTLVPAWRVVRFLTASSSVGDASHVEAVHARCASPSSATVPGVLRRARPVGHGRV